MDFTAPESETNSGPVRSPPVTFVFPDARGMFNVCVAPTLENVGASPVAPIAKVCAGEVNAFREVIPPPPPSAAATAALTTVPSGPNFKNCPSTTSEGRAKVTVATEDEKLVRAVPRLKWTPLNHKLFSPRYVEEASASKDIERQAAPSGARSRAPNRERAVVMEHFRTLVPGFAGSSTKVTAPVSFSQSYFEATNPSCCPAPLAPVHAWM